MYRFGSNAVDSATRVLAVSVVVTIVLAGLAGVTAAQDDPEFTNEQEWDELMETIDDLGTLIAMLIVAVAVPNGAYGLFQWMTAGSNVEKDDSGKKRIRNTFIAIAGAGVITLLVEIVRSITF